MTAGDRIGPYRLLELLGSGGMGKVHLAVVEAAVSGLRLGERVALKVLHPHLVTDFEIFSRFVQEVDIGKRIRHENVVRTIDAGMDLGADGEIVYLAMEHVHGQTLDELLEIGGPLPEATCRRVAREVARGLIGIHGAGVVHADLKPANLLLTNDDVVKITDLGLAQLRGAALKSSTSQKFSGTVLYAAPEQFGDRAALDPRADLYALGISLYELTIGSNPFAHDDVRVVIRRQMDDDPVPLDEAAGTTPFFAAVVARMIAKDPRKRFRSADELFDVLSAGETSGWWRERSGAGSSRNVNALSRLGARRDVRLRGRDDALVETRRVIVESREGRGGVVLAIGEPGVGKTRYLDALVRVLDLLGPDVNCVAVSPADIEKTEADVLLVDDLHHMHDDAQSAFIAFARGVANRRTALVATAANTLDRSFFAELDALPHVSVVRLGRLDEDGLRSILADALEAGGPADALVAEIAAASDGHPTVALAIAAELRESEGLVRDAAGAWTTKTDVASLPLPTRIKALHDAQLATLSEEERDLIDLASLLDDPLDAAVLAVVTGESKPAVLKRLTRMQRVHRVLVREGDSFAFETPTLRRHLAATMPEILHEEYQRMLADAMAARDSGAPKVVGHLVRGADFETAVPMLEDAFRGLDADGAHREIVEVADRVLGAPHIADDVQTKTHAWRALALLALGRADEARAAIEASLGVERDATDD